MITSQAVLLVLWKSLPAAPETGLIKLIAYAACLTVFGPLARFGLLPRRRPILPGVIGRAD